MMQALLRCVTGRQMEYPALFAGFVARYGTARAGKEIIGSGGRPQWMKHEASPSPGPGRLRHGDRQRSILPWEEEQAFVAHLERRAGEGIAMDVRAIQAELVRWVGRPVSRDTVYRILKRQGYVWVGRRPWWERRHRILVAQRRRQRSQIEKEYLQLPELAVSSPPASPRRPSYHIQSINPSRSSWTSLTDVCRVFGILPDDGAGANAALSASLHGVPRSICPGIIRCRSPPARFPGADFIQRGYADLETAVYFEGIRDVDRYDVL